MSSLGSLILQGVMGCWVQKVWELSSSHSATRSWRLFFLTTLRKKSIRRENSFIFPPTAFWPSYIVSFSRHESIHLLSKFRPLHSSLSWILLKPFQQHTNIFQHFSSKAPPGTPCSFLPCHFPTDLHSKAPTHSLYFMSPFLCLSFVLQNILLNTFFEVIMDLLLFPFP